jgi:hypothetical protein
MNKMRAYLLGGVAMIGCALVYGARQPRESAAGKFDRCNTDMVANPDNINYPEAMRTLFIGEDSGNHLNNFTWAFNVAPPKTCTNIRR